MKRNIQSILPLFVCVLCFLLVCTILCLLYTFDLISTHLFEAASLFLGCLFYMMLGTVFFKTVKKRQFIIAFILVTAVFIIQLTLHSFSQELLQKSIKLFLFLLTVVFLQFKHHS